MSRLWTLLALLLTLLYPAAPRDRAADHYALLLEDPPLVAQIGSREELESLHTRQAGQRLLDRQRALRQELERRGIQVTATSHILVNAIFVRTSADRVEELRRLPGVRRVEYLPPIRLHLNRALDLSNARAAWNRIGGFANAGAGVKIGIIDSGIDHQHPALLDDSLRPPPGYPKCVPRDCPYTSNKVIVARSYVEMLAAGTPPNPAEDSRPDDPTPRDRVGHGTAVAVIAAGREVSTPSATISGVAPKAFLGNYKIFGSPGVNDTTYGDVVIAALEDAFRDGMDIVTLSLGSAAVYGPLDTGAICGANASEPCDVRALAVENAVKAGMLAVVSAGNDGDTGLKYPALNSVNTPGTAPSALTVGAITNAHVWFSRVGLEADNAPAELRKIPARFGDGPRPVAPLTAPIKDVEKLGDDGRACRPLPAGSLSGAVALVQRGGCSFALKVFNAENAGAVGVVIYQLDGVDSIFSPAGLAGSGVPAVMIPNSAGKQLKSFLAGNPDARVILDPTLTEWEAPSDEVAVFSSRGPSIGEYGIKPELVAVGTDLFTATQRYDPNSELWDPTGVHRGGRHELRRRIGGGRGSARQAAETGSHSGPAEIRAGQHLERGCCRRRAKSERGVRGRRQTRRRSSLANPRNRGAGYGVLRGGDAGDARQLAYADPEKHRQRAADAAVQRDAAGRGSPRTDHALARERDARSGQLRAAGCAAGRKPAIPGAIRR
jgi:minor extracellular serine protease Vpr